ncbi:D-alanyl-D-alanine carboxypeptidase/D-alanyl-D-alanine-endopeptidase [Candidatus Marinamargulisbacteria bacterium SCGC AAA071-K20]|nr:D-alanyl-D-alanine carboxypeptidase/D-alanyl-D-alanine-endopeptidase [Candidatus Marinamargulisbacteria bacterium SCGC AAA071-K20]
MRFRYLFTALLFSIPVFAASLDEQLFHHIKYQLSESKYEDVSLGIVVDKISRFKKKRLFEKNAKELFIPASTIKPLLSLAVLDQFGKNYKFKTFLMSDRKIKNDVLDGNIYIKGMGDPSLQREDLEKIVLKLKTMGLSRIKGDVVYDTTLFKNDDHPHYKNARYYNAPSGALSLDYNQLNFVIDSNSKAIVSEFPTSYVEISIEGDVLLNNTHQGFPWPAIEVKQYSDHYVIHGDVTPKDQDNRFLNVMVSRPGLFFSTQFKELCTKKGIEITGVIRPGVIPKSHVVLLEYEGAKLASIIKELNQESNNVVAKILNKDLAAFRGKVPADKASGVAILRQFCKQKLKFKEGSFVLKDASGLSLENRISADQLSLMLQYIYKKRRIREVMITSFVKLGEHEKYKHLIPPDHLDVYIKTGTLASNGINSVIGYVFNNNNGEVYSFSILTDHQTNVAYKGTLTYPILRSLFLGLGS